MRVSGAVRPAGVGAQFEGGASCRLEARRGDRALPDDGEKEWKQNPQGMQKPKLVLVDFRSAAQIAARDAGEMSSAGAAKAT